jgi:hypothetical protein
MSIRLTFGVELEFLVATLRDDEPNPYPQHPWQVHIENDSIGESNIRLQNAIVQVLQGVGFPPFDKMALSPN